MILKEKAVTENFWPSDVQRSGEKGNIFLDLRKFDAWKKFQQIFSQMVVKNGDLQSHGTSRKRITKQKEIQVPHFEGKRSIMVNLSKQIGENGHV